MGGEGLEEGRANLRCPSAGHGSCDRRRQMGGEEGGSRAGRTDELSPRPVTRDP